MKKIMTIYTFLIVGNHHVHMDSLKAAWKNRASVKIISADNVDQIPSREFDIIILDGSVGEKIIDLTHQLAKRYPKSPLLVMTLSPEWRTAREVFLAGATDYAQWPGAENAATLISLIELRINSLQKE